MPYFDWLQRGNPTGTPTRLPELHDRFESSMPGVYCIGDLTGVPLIKRAAESGVEIIRQLHADEAFQHQRAGNHASEVLDLVIIGAGPAGVAAVIRARQLDYRCVVLEASRTFRTIHDFPSRKPIIVTPAEPPATSDLAFTDGAKESLLEQLGAAVKDRNLPIYEGVSARQVSRDGDALVVETTSGSHRALRVIVAMGRSGNRRTLAAPGADLPHVFTRLVDATHHHNENVLVVGGGDSAVEAALALADAGNRVTLSYRQPALSRAKPHNIERLGEYARQNRITPIFESTVAAIRRSYVALTAADGKKEIPADAVYVLIGREAPLSFFQRSGIRIEGQRRAVDWIGMTAFLALALVICFGRKAPVTPVNSLQGFLLLPLHFLSMQWAAAVTGLGAWLGAVVLVGSALPLVALSSRSRAVKPWDLFKRAFFSSMMALFMLLYATRCLKGAAFLGWDMGTWYAALYSLTVVVFGVRRMVVRPTAYIRNQTLTLMAIQVIPLFVLPVLVLPWMGAHGLLGSWVMNNVFPGHSYWRAYGFILAWPLFLHNLASAQPVAFWLVLSLVQTFVVIPWIVYQWGKGAYCGWICSCGALAETLGDEYRTRAWHGASAKKAENAGQIVLWCAVVVSLPIMFKAWTGAALPGMETLSRVYAILVDMTMSGVLGIGLYFAFTGRVWCRFFCPLAALMHIYARFSRYRIFADKKRCISCEICTKACHMGIDVMAYAATGRPMDDVECVRCSACVTSCPLQVLSFGTTDRARPSGNAPTGAFLPDRGGVQAQADPL